MARLSSEDRRLVKSFIKTEKAIPVGVDLARDVFQVCYCDPETGSLRNFQLNRDSFFEWGGGSPFGATPMCVAIEACGSCNFWARYFRSAGHSCRVLPVIKIKAHMQSTCKSDKTDAYGIWKSLLSYVSSIVPKEPLAAAVSSMISVRALVARQKVQCQNAARALLYEMGIACYARGDAVISRLIDEADRLTDEKSPVAQPVNAAGCMLRDAISSQSDILEKAGSCLSEFASSNALCRNLMTIPGVGPVSAVTLYPALSRAEDFPDGRHFASYAGVAPAVTGTGGKTRVLGVKSAGSREFKKVLFMAALGNYKRLQKDPGTALSRALREGKPPAVMISALANRIARVTWAVARSGRPFDAARCSLMR